MRERRRGYMDLQREWVSPGDRETMEQVRALLQEFGLGYEEADHTLVLWDRGRLVGTCSKARNVVKCFAVAKDYQGQGLAAILLTEMCTKLFAEGYYHYFLFTQPQRRHLFEGLGYEPVVVTDRAALLESGNQSIWHYLKGLQSTYHLPEDCAALVMNCNPFTLGHQALIERAAAEKSRVLVFVLEEERSSFPFALRFQLVQQGVAHLKGVTVIPGGPYLISSATFPNYFLRREDEKLEVYTELDASLFGTYFGRGLGVTRRYVATEPYCPVTRAYHQMLAQILPRYGIELQILPRKEWEGQAISASQVRRAWRGGQWKALEHWVPGTTLAYLTSPEGEALRTTMEKGEGPH